MSRETLKLNPGVELEGWDVAEKTRVGIKMRKLGVEFKSKCSRIVEQGFY